MPQSPSEINRRYYEKRKKSGLDSLQKKRKDRLRREGRCIDCGKDKGGDDTVHCRSCLDALSSARRKKIKERKCNVDGCPNTCWTRSNYCQEHLAEWRKSRKNTHEIRLERGLCASCGERPRDNTKWQCRDCSESINRNHRKRRRKGKELVLNLYGGKCTCCGESQFEFLSLDHKNNDGFKEKVNGRRSSLFNALYRDYSAGKPLRDDLQIHCYNCNCAKGFYGVCPHERARKEKTNVG